MTVLPIGAEVLGRSFVTALLITGSAERAEAAVLEAIQTTDPSDISAEALLDRTVSASIAGQLAGQREDEKHLAVCSLPVELRNVLNLSTSHRRCFVLRVLLGLSGDVCARMLQTGIRQIDDLLYEATRALAFPPQEIKRSEFATGNS
jgi:hypothetical protein